MRRILTWPKIVVLFLENFKVHEPGLDSSCCAPFPKLNILELAMFGKRIELAVWVREIQEAHSLCTRYSVDMLD